MLILGCPRIEANEFKVLATFKLFGAVLGTKVFEAEDNFPRIVIIKFPTYEKALEWYHSDEYKPVKAIRLSNSEGSNIIVKGL